MLREKRRHANSKPNRKLDRKSSRGMIFENEELRLRTININAEVERGQSDNKKLVRENEHLRREIWSLRDLVAERDDLIDKLQRTKGGELGERPAHPERTTVTYERHHAGDDDEDEEDDDEDEDEDEEGEEEDEEPICEHCQQYEDSCDCSLPDKITNATNAPFRPRPPPRDRTNFDDLSVVSEETTHSTDTVVTDPDTQRLSLNAPSLGAFEYQSNVPSLAHFENLCYERIGPNLTASGELVYAAGSDDKNGNGAEKRVAPIPPPRSPTVTAVPPAFQDEKGASNGPPDICMYTAGMPLRMRQRGGHHNGSAGRFPTGGNLDDLLHDLDNLTVDHSLTLGGDQTKRNKRSEMNLILSHDGAISSISNTPVTPAAIPISVDSPSPQHPLPPLPLSSQQQQQSAPSAVGWRSDLPPKPDKPPKPKFPWIGRAVQPTDAAQAPQHTAPLTPTSAESPQPQSQHLRRKSIPVAISKSPSFSGQPQPGHAAKAGQPATATISKRRFSLLRRSSDAITAATAAAAAAAVASAGGDKASASVGPSSAHHGGAGSSAERTTTTHGGSVSSSSPESSTSMSMRSQRPQLRRISTGSHDNATGSIPWCACWGNGCI